MTAEEMYKVINKQNWALYYKIEDFLKVDDFQGGTACIKDFFQCDDELAEKCLMICKEKIYDPMVARHSTEEWKRREAEVLLAERKRANQPKCPTCSSTNIQKIGAGERAASVAVFGLFSKKINKSFKCKNCGYTW